MSGGSFTLDEALALLARTPATLDALLRGLPEPWLVSNEGRGTWSAFDVVGHLVHGERTDWMPRVAMILDYGEARTFEPFDREAQFGFAADLSLGALLDEFGRLRTAGLAQLRGLELTAADLDRRGRHPAFSAVTLRQLLATWVAHDLDHVSQIARVLAHRYAGDVGPWRAYLRIISGQPG